jgi:hypothetical protein
VFDPNAPNDLDPDQIPGFVNDHIARTLAGVSHAGRPVFLKIVYHGPKALEELVTYDPHLVVGILGGAAGTTYDAFKLLAEAQKHGARAALYGRKINNAECQLAFIEFLRLIIEHQITPEEAVRAYHGVLQQLKIRPHRSLEDDLVLQTNVMSYGESQGRSSKDKVQNNHEPPGVSRQTNRDAAHACDCGGTDPNSCHCHDTQSGATGATDSVVGPSSDSASPDFSKMTQAEKLAYNKARRDRIFG